MSECSWNNPSNCSSEINGQSITHSVILLFTEIFNAYTILLLTLSCVRWVIWLLEFHAFNFPRGKEGRRNWLGKGHTWTRGYFIFLDLPCHFLHIKAVYQLNFWRHRKYITFKKILYDWSHMRRTFINVLSYVGSYKAFGNEISLNVW